MNAAPGNVLLACFEPPGYGGASTSGYQLYRRLRECLDARYLNLVSADDLARFQRDLGEDVLNPEALPGVDTFALGQATFKPQPGLAEAIAAHVPVLVLAIGYIAAHVVRQARPDLPMIVLATGCQQVKDALAAGAADVQTLLAGDAALPAGNDIEPRALAGADLVVAHSDLVHRLYRRCFPALGDRLHPEVLWFHDWIHGAALRHRALARPFAARDIDLLFVASDWARVEKNYPLLADIVARLAGRAIHVVGAVPRTLPGVVHHGLLAHAQTLALMGRARVLACPSSFDAAPGILFEGAAMGCNLVASANCGNVQLCPPMLQVRRYHADGFVDAILPALARPWPARTAAFDEAAGFDRLLSLLTAFTRQAALPGAQAL